MHRQVITPKSPLFGLCHDMEPRDTGYENRQGPVSIALGAFSWPEQQATPIWDGVIDERSDP